MTYFTSHFGHFSVKTMLLTASLALLTACSGGGSNDSPKTGNENPKTDNEKPKTGSEKPKTGSEKPTTGGTGNDIISCAHQSKSC